VPQDDLDLVALDVDGRTVDELEEEARVVEAHPEVVATLDRLPRVPSRPPPRPLSLTEVEDLRIEDVSRARAWLAAAGRNAALRRRTAESLRLTSLGFVLGGDYARLGPSVSWLIGTGIESGALAGAREAIASGPVAAGDARALADVLDRADPFRPLLANVVDFERAAFRGSWLDVVTGRGDEAVHSGWRHFWSFRVYVAAALDAWDEAADGLREAAVRSETDGREALARASRVDARFEESSLVRMVTGFGPMLVRKSTAVHVDRTLARTAVALVLHRAETGSLPGSLADLVPRHLPRVPTDPWDGRPVRWSTQGTPRLWSVGKDGHDDGGAIPGSEDEADDGDVVWTVWDGP
jgi:hypothetical protein